LMFAGVFYLYFIAQTRLIGYNDGIRAFTEGYWWIYIAHVALFAAFIAASAIDLELWIIPLSLCWFITLFMMVFSTLSGLFVSAELLEQTTLIPLASTKTAALAVGASIGLAVSLLLLKKGLIRQSYPGLDEAIEERLDDNIEQPTDEPEYNDRIEMLKEIVFLLPILAAALITYLVLKDSERWHSLCANIYVKSLLGSVYGYFIGCGVVWATRILGTLGFGREAMGLGDVHLLGAAGAICGAMAVTTAFFIAPFFGLIMAMVGLFYKENREIPYGPFLSLAVFVVMIFQDRIMEKLSIMFGG